MTQGISFTLTKFRNLRLLFSAAPLLLGALITGCSTIDPSSQGTGSTIGGLIIPSNFDQALKENQKALANGKGQPDVALYNIGVISAHSANPKKDYSRALLSFRTLVKDYPSSVRAEQAQIWIQALEQNQKNAEEGQKLTEEKRTLVRERDQLAQERTQLTQERNKLNYAIEKSRQLDAEIEKRRKQSLKR
jgi:hypothetical protein